MIEVSEIESIDIDNEEDLVFAKMFESQLYNNERPHSCPE